MDLSDASDRIKASPGTAGVLCDFDGTLAPIVDDPEAAAAVEGAAGLLERLASRYRLVAVVSGREAPDVAARAGARGVLYCGLYGAEEWLDGELRRPPEAESWQRAAAAIAAEAGRLIEERSLAGWWVEDKRLAVSVHFRTSGFERAPQDIVAWAVQEAARRGFHAAPGRMVIEFRPAGVSKAATAERLVREHGLTPVLFAGDDAADVEAFVRLREILGDSAITAGVASGEEPEGLRAASSLILAGPREVAALLRELAS